VFRRRQQAQPTQPAPPGQAQSKSGGKGRPTPKRSEAEKQRRARVNPPKDRRESAKLRRERTREARARQREGLLRGDEKYLSARDRGPLRGFVRDYVDARRTAMEFFLPSAIVILVLGLIRSPQMQQVSLLVWYIVIVVMVGNSIVLVRGVKRQLRARFPDGSTRGVTAYALMRSMQLRRFRLPPPRVKPGAKI